MVMDLHHVRSFAEVAERGTMAAAATAQGYTGPAVSQHIAKLEASLGAQLFDRVGGRVVLTPAGTAFLPVALQMLDLDARARQIVRDNEVRPRVVIAGFASAISTVLVPRLPALRSVADIELHEAEDAEALRDLGLGTVDIVLTQEYQGAATERNDRFEYRPLATDRLTLVLPPTWPSCAALGQLRDAPWLVNGAATRCAQATVRVLASAGITPRIVGSVADNATLLDLVATGHGVAAVPSLILQDGRHHVAVAPFDLGVSRTVYAVSRSATAPSLSPLLDVLSSPD